MRAGVTGVGCDDATAWGSVKVSILKAFVRSRTPDQDVTNVRFSRGVYKSVSEIFRVV